MKNMINKKINTPSKFNISGSSLQIVKDALMHKETKRVPVDIGGTRASGIHISAYSRYRKSLGLAQSYPEMQIRYLQLPKIDEDFRSIIGTDLESYDPYTSAEETPIYNESNGRFYIDRWGCKWFMPKGGSYFDITQYPLNTAESISDIKNYKWPDEKSPALLANINKEINIIVNEHKRALFLGRTCPGIYEMLHILCGPSKALTDLAGNPKLSDAIMEKILELKLEYYEAIIKSVVSAGVDYFVISESDDLGSQNGLIMNPKMYRKFIKPKHTILFKFIKQFSGGRAFVELHSCGAIRELIPDFIESGVDILNPIQVSSTGMNDTKSLKKDFGNDLVFHGGGIDSQHTLPYGTPEEVRDEVKRRIYDLSPGGGFIFTPVHSIQPDVPFDNFVEMLIAYREIAGL